MKTIYLLYEIRNKFKFKLYLIGEFETKARAKNEMQRYYGQGKLFVVKKIIQL